MPDKRRASHSPPTSVQSNVVPLDEETAAALARYLSEDKSYVLPEADGEMLKKMNLDFGIQGDGSTAVSYQISLLLRLLADHQQHVRPPAVRSAKGKLKRYVRNHRITFNEKIGNDVYNLLIDEFPDERLVKKLVDEVNAYKAKLGSELAGSQSQNIPTLNMKVRRYKAMVVRHKEKDGNGSLSDKFKLAKDIEKLAQSTQGSNTVLSSLKKEYEKKWEELEKNYDAAIKAEESIAALAQILSDEAYALPEDDVTTLDGLDFTPLSDASSQGGVTTAVS